MPPGLNASNNTSHSGTVVIIKDAMPDGMRCSAHESTPISQSKSAMPTIAVEIHCLLVGAASPAMRRQTKRIAPAIRKRKASDIKGGIVSTTNQIARYVEPQTIYSVINAIQILAFTFLQCYNFAFWLLPRRAMPFCAARRTDNCRTRQPCG